MTNRARESAFKILARHFVKDESGATALEYGVMIALIAAVIITIVISVGGRINDAFTFVDGEMENITQP